MTYSGKRLYRSNTEKTIAGVLGGIAEYFDIDPTLVRLGYVLLSLFSAAFPGVLGYIIMWIVMPQNPNNGAYPTSHHATNKPSHPFGYTKTVEKEQNMRS